MMAKITAIVPDEEAAEIITSRLATFRSDDLDWRLVNREEDTERIFPALAWSGDSSSRTAGGGPLGVPVRTDYPEEEVIEDRGVDDNEAEFYGQSVAHGGTAIIIEAPSEHANAIRRILEEANAQQIAID
jgi:hypothetical protein